MDGGNMFVGSTFNLANDSDRSDDESEGSGANSPAPWAQSTTLTFDGDFRVENANMFLGNIFNGGRFRGGGTGAGPADPEHDNLYVGDTFRVRGTIDLTGGVYHGNAFTARRIIIRGNALFVGGNSFTGDVQVEDPDLVAQENYLGEITAAHADEISPL
ncbi:hypothetical protein [Streptomyces sp. NPDC058579]|uniref:hypothetical protein n=1 Tax=Streptomyces sp. NPDC058579 TaxID=3346548 RepID=UPI00365BE04B